MRVCVFVDGENFRHSIVKLFPEFPQQHYLPKQANWTELFNWIVSKCTDEEGERIRTYWYVIKSVDFFPYHFPNPEKEQSNARNLLSKHEPYKAELDTLSDDMIIDRMKTFINELEQTREKFQNRFNGWTAIQDGISSQQKAVEFRRAGYCRYDLFTQKIGKEKAVDVKLASDLITLKDIYDIAIIVTGDQDYVPAVEVVKDCGKRVVNVAFKTRGGELLPGGARRLNQITDWHYDIGYDNLDEHLCISQLPLKNQQ